MFFPKSLLIFVAINVFMAFDCGIIVTFVETLIDIDRNG